MSKPTKNVAIPFGRGNAEIAVPGDFDIITPPGLPCDKAEEEIIRDALDAEPPFAHDFRPGERVTLIVPDRTRRCRADVILPSILERLTDRGIGPEDITVIMANGSHTGNTPDQRRELLGASIADNVRIIEHDCHDEASLQHIGATARGNQVWVNRHVLECDRRVIVSGVQHHYMAGFGGGPKMLVPGCAGYETIRRNHALAVDPHAPRLRPECAPGRLEDNPVMKEILEATALLHVDYTLQVVLDPRGRIGFAAGGDLRDAYRLAGQAADLAYSVHLGEPRPVVIAGAGGRPKDINLIQSHKAIRHAFRALAPGGTLVVFAACDEGVGSATFLRWFEGSDLEDTHRLLRDDFTLNGNTALSIIEMACVSTLILVTNLPKDLVEKIGMVYAEYSGTALNMPDLCPHDVDFDYGYVLPVAGWTVPIMGGA